MTIVQCGDTGNFGHKVRSTERRQTTNNHDTEN